MSSRSGKYSSSSYLKTAALYASLAAALAPTNSAYGDSSKRVTDDDSSSMGEITTEADASTSSRPMSRPRSYIYNYPPSDGDGGGDDGGDDGGADTGDSDPCGMADDGSVDDRG